MFLRGAPITQPDTKPMKPAVILAVLGTALGFAAGYFIGQGRNDTASARSAGKETLIGRAPGSGSRSDANSSAPGAGAAAPLPGAPAEDASFDDKDAFVRHLAATDPQRAIAWAQANSDSRSLDDLFQSIATVWAKRDPEAAFTWAEGLSLSREREDAIRGVMTGAFEAGHEAVALSFIDRLPPGEYQDTAMVAAVQHLAATDLNRAFVLAGSMGETDSMRYAGRAIAEALLASGRIDEAKQRIAELPYGSLRRELTIGMIERLGDDNVDAVAAWIAQHPIGPDGGEIFDSRTMRNISYSLAYDVMREGDPAKALAWAVNFSDPNVRNDYLERIGEAWSERSPKEASDWLINTINERGFDGLHRVSEGIFEEWIAADQIGPFERIERIADPKARTQAAFMALHELADENPRVAAERLAAYASADPEKAAQVTGRLMQSWLRRDPEQASTWLNAQPPGDVKDSGVAQLVSSLVREDRDAESARAWLGEMQNQEFRNKLILEVERLEGAAPAGAVRSSN